MYTDTGQSIDVCRDNAEKNTLMSFVIKSCRHFCVFGQKRDECLLTITPVQLCLLEHLL